MSVEGGTKPCRTCHLFSGQAEQRKKAHRCRIVFHCESMKCFSINLTIMNKFIFSCKVFFNAESGSMQNPDTRVGSLVASNLLHIVSTPTPNQCSSSDFKDKEIHAALIFSSSVPLILQRKSTDEPPPPSLRIFSNFALGKFRQMHMERFTVASCGLSHAGRCAHTKGNVEKQ